MNQNDFLGRGWSFPPTFETETANVEMLEKEADIKSSLEILLSTMPGERIMLPRYGSNLENLLFESLNLTTKTIIIDQIKTAILFYEPRIDVQKIHIVPDQDSEGILLVEIDYVIRSTNTRFNFVFPFYKQEGTDIATENKLINS